MAEALKNGDAMRQLLTSGSTVDPREAALFLIHSSLSSSLQQQKSKLEENRAKEKQL